MGEIEGFAARLRARREQIGLTRPKLSELTDIAEQTIGALEQGRQHRLRPDEFARLADALYTSTDALIVGAGDADRLGKALASIAEHAQAIGKLQIATTKNIKERVDLQAAMAKTTDAIDGLRKNGGNQAKAIEEVQAYSKSLYDACVNMKTDIEANTGNLHAVISRLEKVEQGTVAEIPAGDLPLMQRITESFEAVLSRLEALEQRQQQLLANQHALGTDNQTLETNLSALSSNIAIMATDMHKRLAVVEGTGECSPDDIQAARERGERWAEKVDESLEQQAARQFNFDKE